VHSETKPDNAMKMFDLNNMNYNDDMSAPCFAGMEFRKGYVAVLSKVRFYLGDKRGMSKYASITKFQGSSDGTTYTDLFTFDENVHTGWNYHEWEADKHPKYRFYRFYGAEKYSCAISEAELTGVETIDDTQDVHKCPPKLFVDGIEQSLTGDVTYSSANTALLSKISPRYGNVVGGDDVTFTGTGFSDKTEDYSIVIDGIPCVAKTASLTTVTCTTGKRPGLKNSTLEIMIAGKGLVSTQGKLFIYANYWSADTTWGGEFAPMEDESIYVPAGLNLVVDVDKSPLLKAVIVEG